MADNLMLRKESGWMVICTAPDVCRTLGWIPIPFPVVAFLQDSAKVQDNVRANQHPFVLHDQSCVTTTWGDQLGILKGVKSQTVGAECYPIDKSGSFRVNGKWTVRADDAFWMNGQGGMSGNTRGKVVKIPSMKTMLNQSLDALQLGLDLVGLIPGLGEIADGVNAVIYLARGDYTNAALSGAAMIPFAGWGATGAKLGNKAVKATQTAKKTAEAAAKAKKGSQSLGAKIKGFWDKLKCPKCSPLKGNPVNPVYGTKIELGDKDTDFVLNSAFPLQWSRSYSSDSPVGTSSYPLAWYGQGWDSPYSTQIKVQPSLELIEILLPLGQVITCPYLEAGDEYFIVQYNLTLIREAVSDSSLEHEQYQFRLCTGPKSGATQFYEFYHQVQSDHTKPEHLVLCTGHYDVLGNRIGLEYLYKDEVRQHYPSHLYDALDRVLTLEFIEIDGQVRLSQIVHLQELNALLQHDSYSTSRHKHQSTHQNSSQPQSTALDLSERIFRVEHMANQELMDFEDFVRAKVLARYEYSNSGDLIKVYVDDSPVEAQTPDQFKLRLTRRFDWNNHIMTAHHLVGGISSYYEYDEYSPQGKVTRHWMSTGEEFHFQYYDGCTEVISAPNTPIAQIERFYFDSYNYLTQYTNGLGHSEYFEYNNKQQLIRKTNAEGGITEYQYSQANITKIRSLIQYHPATQIPEWREIALTWSNGLLTQITDPLGNTETTAYDIAGQPLQMVDALGRQTRIKYTPTGLPYQVTDAKGGHKRLLWDQFGNLLKYQDCSAKTTEYSYDAYGRLTRSKNALGHETRYQYYAHQFQPSLIHYPDGTSEQFKYDVLERLIEYRDALGRSTRYEYSHDHLPCKRIDAANGVVTYQYDELRRFVGLINENAQQWSMQYDAANQLIAETTFDQVHSEYEYSPAGYLYKHHQFTDQQKKRYSTVFQRDLLGQLIEQYIVDHHDLSEKKRIRYQYDVAGQLLEARNADSHVKLKYDAVGQLTEEQLIAHWLNNTTNEHVQRSHRLTHVYDELGNRTETTLPDGRKLKTMYYGSGHAWNYALEDHQGIHEISTLQRDDLHQEISRSQGPLSSAFQLDNMGRLVQQTVSQDQSYQARRIERLYQYDKAGQLKEISDKRFIEKDHVWQRSVQYQYDVLSRLTASELSTIGKSENYIQMRERFAFDPASNILPVQQASLADSPSDRTQKIRTNRVEHLEQEHQTIDYVYDDLGRVKLKQIKIKDKTAFGHIRQHLNAQHILNQFSTREIELEWDEQNQLKSSKSTKPDGRGGQDISHTQYCYDPFGRRIAKQSQVYKKNIIHIKPKNKQSYGNHLASTDQTHTQIQHIYNYAIWSVWDGNRILQDHTANHVFTTVYEANEFVPLARLVWLQDQLIQPANDAKISTDQDQMASLQQIALHNLDGFETLNQQELSLNQAANDVVEAHSQHRVYWYQNDHLGTPRELTQETGEIAWEAVYQAWGNTVTVEWQEVEQNQALNAIELNTLEHAYLLQPHRFQGQIYDVETGLHYNRFRYYDPDAGRFISHDPIGLYGGFNHFQYAPNPVEWIDPLGLARMSKPGSRAGKDFTRAGKNEVKKLNQIKNCGLLLCEICDTDVVTPKQHTKGVKPPDNEAHIDHKVPKSKGGSGTPENGQVLCRVCNLGKSNKFP